MDEAILDFDENGKLINWILYGENRNIKGINPQFDSLENILFKVNKGTVCEIEYPSKFYYSNNDLVDICLGNVNDT